MAPVGEAWNCPHCGQRILRSAVSCPACQRRLRFDAVTAAHGAGSAIYPLRVEGTIHHPPSEASWEYSVLVQVRDAQGAVVARHVVGVGAIQPGDTRTFLLQVEMRGPEDAARAATAARPPASERGKPDSPSSSRPQEVRKTEPSPLAKTTNRAE
jgi:hypothetical protein